MTKYDPLRDHLSKYKGAKLQLTFQQITNIIAPEKLPPSAYDLRQWWQNSYSAKRKHVQAVAWHKAGWKVDVGGVNFQRQTVTFVKQS